MSPMAACPVSSRSPRAIPRGRPGLARSGNSYRSSAGRKAAMSTSRIAGPPPMLSKFGALRRSWWLSHPMSFSSTASRASPADRPAPRDHHQRDDAEQRGGHQVIGGRQRIAGLRDQPRRRKRGESAEDRHRYAEAERHSDGARLDRKLLRQHRGQDAAVTRLDQVEEADGEYRGGERGKGDHQPE